MECSMNSNAHQTDVRSEAKQKNYRMENISTVYL